MSVKRIRGLAVFAFAAAVAQTACDSGSYGSDVDAASNVPPTARAQVLNGGRTDTFREGSEVLLTGKDSEDSDGPILEWNWSQTAGPPVTIVEISSTTASFTAPDVDAETTLSFMLSVTDSYQLTDEASLDVTVLPAQDADRFLTLALRSGVDSSRDTFTIIPALSRGSGEDEPFVLSVQAYLIYPSLGSLARGSVTNCRHETLPQSSAVPPTVGNCSIVLLSDLTPFELPGGEGTGISDSWSSDAPATQPTNDEGRIDAAWNPRFSFRVPRLDIADFNQQFLPDRRNETLPPAAVDEAVIALRVELAAEDPTVAGALIGSASPDSPDDKSVFLSLPNDGTGSPISEWLDLEQVLASIERAESNLTAEVYYQAVDPGPSPTRLTLNDWLCQAGFAEPDGCGPLEPGETRLVTLRDEARRGASGPTEEFARAVYMNNYDLGLGRDMFTRVDHATGNVYAFVRNHLSLEGALRGSEPIVTVVMEFSPPENENGPIPGAEPFTKFFTYTPNGSGDSDRVNTMNFDGRGELRTPGNCVACHGGRDPAGGFGSPDGITLNQAAFDRFGQPCDSSSTDAVCYVYPNNGDLDATFLPWDLDSLLFVDDDPAIVNAPVRFDGQSLQSELESLSSVIGLTGGVGKSEQTGQVRRLNEAALATYVQDAATTASSIELLTHWYGALDTSSFPPAIDGDYCDAEECGADAPVDWQGGANGTALYFDVYARNCRMCHTNIREDVLKFDSYAKFINALNCASPETCGAGVFTRGIMPAARLTMDRFWVNFETGGQSAGDRLGELLVLEGLLDEAPTPPAPAANITILPSTRNINDQSEVIPRHGTVRLSAETSDFADSIEWSAGPGFPDSGPVLVGVNAPQMAFTPDAPGSYPITLTINGNVTASTILLVENYVPVAADDQQGAEPGGPSISVNFLLNDSFQREACAPACTDFQTLANAPDLPFSVSLELLSDNDADGTFQMLEGAPCSRDAPEGCVDDRLEYTPAAVADSYTDVFSYTITDADGDMATGTITISAVQDLEGSASIPLTVTSDIPQTLELTVTGGAQAPIGSDRYSVTVVSQPSLGTLSNLAPTSNGSEEFDYESDDFATGNEFFTLRVSDSGGTFADVIFDFEVQPQVRFSTGLLPLLQDELNCNSCHDVDAGTLDRPSFRESLQSPANYLEVMRAVTLLNGSVDVENSKLLCVPRATDPCPPTVNAPHDGGTGLYNSIQENLVRRWLQEGAQNN